MSLNRENNVTGLLDPLGTRIKKLRKQRRISIQEVADHIGKSAVTVKNYEYNHRVPSIQTLKLIAQKLNTSTDFLLGLSEISERTIPSDFDELLEKTNLNQTGLNHFQQQKLRERLKETKDALILYLKKNA